ncbi:MAG: hypothetical protein JWL95_2381 [Gemmatimonadetes bacterium]|nr:hypothetical protein [Gemmatimonadota bacterium]
MPLSPKYLLVGLGTLALAACGTDRRESPLLPTSVSLSVAPSACSFTSMHADAASYFSSASDPVFGAIAAMESLVNHGGSASAINDAGFNVLARVAGALESSGAIGGTPSTGDLLVKDVLRCSTIGSVATGFSFADALGPDGLFEVLGGTHDEPANIGTSRSVTSRGASVYGAEPQTGQTWAGSVGGTRFLLYGYLIPPSSFVTVESLAPGGFAFELSALPVVTFSPRIEAGACTAGTGRFPIQHTTTILPNVYLDFCPATSASTRRTENRFLSLVERASGWFAPKELYAMAAGGGSGGLISGLSPFAPVDVDASKVALTSVQTITDKHLNEPFTVVISVRTTTPAPAGSPHGMHDGTPLADIPVSLHVNRNNGSWTHPGPTLAVTDVNGRATFTGLSVDKAGGYTLVATAPVLGATLTVTTNPFHVQNR